MFKCILLIVSVLQNHQALMLTDVPLSHVIEIKQCMHAQLFTYSNDILMSSFWDTISVIC